MDEHVTALVLDEIAAGQGAPSDVAHVEACPKCQEALARVREQADQVRRSLAFRRAENALMGELEAKGRAKRTRGIWIALPVALAAGLAVLMVLPDRRDEVRLKGQATLEVRAQGGEKRDAFRPGERVELRVGAAGCKYLIVMAADMEGNVARLWPASSDRSGEVPQGASATLSPPFEVTPGSIQLYALFSDQAIAEEAARAAVRKSLGGDAVIAPGELARARFFMRVE